MWKRLNVISYGGSLGKSWWETPWEKPGEIHTSPPTVHADPTQPCRAGSNPKPQALARPAGRKAQTPREAVWRFSGSRTHTSHSTGHPHPSTEWNTHVKWRPTFTWEPACEAYSSFIHDSPKLGTAHMSYNRTDGDVSAFIQRNTTQQFPLKERWCTQQHGWISEAFCEVKAARIRMNHTMCAAFWRKQTHRTEKRPAGGWRERAKHSGLKNAGTQPK